MFQIWMGQKAVTLEIDGSVFAINFLVQHAKYQSCCALWGRKMQKQFSPVKPQEELLNYSWTMEDLSKVYSIYLRRLSLHVQSIKGDKEIKDYIKSTFAQAKKEGFAQTKNGFFN